VASEGPSSPKPVRDSVKKHGIHALTEGLVGCPGHKVLGQHQEQLKHLMVLSWVRRRMQGWHQAGCLSWMSGWVQGWCWDGCWDGYRDGAKLGVGLG